MLSANTNSCTCSIPSGRYRCAIAEGEKQARLELNEIHHAPNYGRLLRRTHSTMLFWPLPSSRSNPHGRASDTSGHPAAAIVAPSRPPPATTRRPFNRVRQHNFRRLARRPNRRTDCASSRPGLPGEWNSPLVNSCVHPHRDRSRKTRWLIRPPACPVRIASTLIFTARAWTRG